MFCDERAQPSPPKILPLPSPFYRTSFPLALSKLVTTFPILLMTDSDKESAKHGLALRSHPLLITMIAVLLLAVVVILVVHWYSMQHDQITHRAYQASELPLLRKSSTTKPRRTSTEIALPLSPLQLFPPGHHPENVRVLYQTASNDGPMPSLGIYAAHVAPSAARLGKHKHELQ